LSPGGGGRIKSDSWALDTVESSCDVGIERIEQMPGSNLWDIRLGNRSVRNMKKFRDELSAGNYILVSRFACWQGLIRLGNRNLARRLAHE